jgi:hypothetical protein
VPLFVRPHFRIARNDFTFAARREFGTMESSLQPKKLRQDGVKALPWLVPLSLALAICLMLAAPMRAEGPPEVRIVEDIYEGRPQYRITTPTATWFYDRAGGGFSRLIDPDGSDWISFRKDPLSVFPDSAAAGYRGLGNLVFGGDNPDAGAGHPGFDRCESTLVAPNAIRTVSRSGQWAWTWTFTDRAVVFRMEKAAVEHPWWFLYEGTIAGRWSPQTHYWGTDTGGPRRDIPAIGNQQFGNWRWAYFGDEASPRVLFIGQRQADDLPDTMWYLGNSRGGAVDSRDGMVVFGLGRGPGTRPQFRDAGIEIVVGFIERQVSDAQAHEGLAKIIEAQLSAPSTPGGASDEPTATEQERTE